jgi:hypothetical protein
VLAVDLDISRPLSAADCHILFYLAAEILDDPVLCKDESALSLVLLYSRDIGLKAVDGETPFERGFARRTLKRILRLFRKATTGSSTEARQSLNVPLELLKLLDHKASQSNSNAGFAEVKRLIEFLADEAMPNHILEALVLWSKLTVTDIDIFPILQTILRRAAHAAMNSELSGSLLRLRRARLFLNDSKTTTETDDDDASESIWKRMSNGMLTVAK